jgi:S-adenosylmethionine decarboxylase
MNSNALGRHIIVEYYNCNKNILKDPRLIDTHMRNAALEAKATIVESVFHHFNPWGVSGAVIISESHLAIHTWPEYGYAAVDLFTCGDIDPWKSFNYLKRVFESQHSEFVEMPRGITEKIRKYHPDTLGDIIYKQA